MIYLTIAMAIIYISIGCVFAFTRLFPHIQNYRNVIAGVFIVYGIFRLITGILKLRAHRYNHE